MSQLGKKTLLYISLYKQTYLAFTQLFNAVVCMAFSGANLLINTKI